MRISIILGTRPEIIKMAPIIRCCLKQGIDFFMIHTGQHYSYKMDEIFFEQLNLPYPDYNLKIGSGSHGFQVGNMLINIEKVLLKENPEYVLVEGDTNTVLAGALAAQKLGIKVGHVEAGLRSYDRKMPEEINRIIADHISDLLFAPTGISKSILLGEGILEEKIFVTGNTIVDSIYQNLDIAKSKENTIKKYGLKKDAFFLATVHRQENVDNMKVFSSILDGLELVSKELEFPVVYPVHPRAKKMMRQFSLEPKIYLIDAVDYLTFIQLEKHARLILTDSGGVQEEACVLKVPCITLRDHTERPETLKIGSNILAGSDPEGILTASKMMITKSPDWKHPYGDGKAGERIVEILRN